VTQQLVPARSSQSVAEADLTIVDVIKTLQRRRTVFICVLLACFGFGVLYCVVSTRRFSASGQIQVQKESSDGLGLESMLSDASDASDALSANITLATQASILQSDNLALRVIKDLNLEQTKDFQHRFNPVNWALGLISPAGPKDAPGSTLDNAPARRERALAIFSKHLDVKVVAGTRLISITYRASNPKVAADVVNDLVRALTDYSFQTRYSATNRASEWLAGQLSELKNQAEGLQKKVVELQRSSGVIGVGLVDAQGREEAYSTTLEQMQAATSALAEATANRIVKEAVYQIVKSGNPELISGLAGASGVGTAPSMNNSLALIQSLRGQQSALRGQLAQDTSKLGSSNPKLADERANLQSVDQGIDEEVHRIGQRAKSDYDIAQRAEDGTRQVFDRQKKAADVLNDKAIEYAITRQEADDSRGLYEDLLKRLKEAGVLEGLKSTNITVVDVAGVPAKPSQPNVPMMLAASLLAGLFLGACSAWFVDLLDDSIHTAEYIEQSVHVRPMSVLPFMGRPGKYGRYGTYVNALANTPANLLQSKGTPEGSSDSPRRLLDAPSTAFSEAVRGLRTSLLLSKSRARPQVILVTSSVPGEGKSTVSLNLAHILAQSGTKVLLVEGDMRRPILAERLRLNTTTNDGLSSLISGGHATYHSGIEGLEGVTVLTAGLVPPHPAELLGSDTMGALLTGWKEEYGFILLDSPPLLAVTDAAMLSTMCDFSLLIVRYGVSSRKSLERSYDQLATTTSTANIGIVLNAVDRHSSSYGGYYGYSGGSYYSRKDQEPAHGA
jgi:succinoglycan biosynthesis transport protein ExoP